jgi:hypothetical protein
VTDARIRTSRAGQTGLASNQRTNAVTFRAALPLALVAERVRDGFADGPIDGDAKDVIAAVMTGDVERAVDGRQGHPLPTRRSLPG